MDSLLWRFDILGVSNQGLPRFTCSQAVSIQCQRTFFHNSIGVARISGKHPSQFQCYELQIGDRLSPKHLEWYHISHITSNLFLIWFGSLPQWAYMPPSIEGRPHLVRSIDRKLLWNFLISYHKIWTILKLLWHYFETAFSGEDLHLAKYMQILTQVKVINHWTASSF